MTSDFNSKQASDTIPTFDGNPKNVDIFLSMVELVSNELNAQGKSNLIRFVIAMKLNERVRNVLTLDKLPTTFEELKTSLTKNFKPTKSTSRLHSEIGDMKQRGSVMNYRDKLSSLITELTLLQVSELGEDPNEVAKSTIKRMNEKLALEIFLKGLQEEIRIAVVAAQPSSLAQACEIASTQEQLLRSSKATNLFHINKKYYNNRIHNKYNNNFRSENRPSGNKTSSYNRQQYNKDNTYRNNNGNTNKRNSYNQNYNRNDNSRQNRINTIRQQGNGRSLEIQNESPERDN